MEKKAIVDILLAGGIVAFPTDTVFGLACMMDKKAMDKVYGAKGRSFDKPLPMMCNSLDMIKEVALVSEQAEDRKVRRNIQDGGKDHSDLYSWSADFDFQ